MTLKLVRFMVFLKTLVTPFNHVKNRKHRKNPSGQLH